MQTDPLVDYGLEVAALQLQIAAATAAGRTALAAQLTTELNGRVKSIIPVAGSPYDALNDLVLARRWSNGSTYEMTPAALRTASAQTFNVVDYGAAADGVTNDYTAIAATITAANAAGGGVVVVPKTCRCNSQLVFPAGVQLYCNDGANIDYRGAASPALKYTGRHWQEGMHRPRVDLSSNTNAGIDAIAFWGGISRSVIDAYILSGATTVNGLTIHGVDPTDGVTVNNNQYSNRIRLITDWTVAPSGIGLRLLATEAQPNSSCNANRVQGNIDYPTSIYCMGQGNIFEQVIINTAATAGIQFEGSQTFNNLIAGCYFDSGMGGAPVKIGPANNIVGNHVFTAIGCVGLNGEGQVTIAVAGAENIPYTVLPGVNGYLVLPRRNGTNSVAGIYSADTLSDSTLDVREGVSIKDARLSLAGFAYSGGINKVSDKGGASLGVFMDSATNPTGQARIVGTVDGSAFTRWIDFVYANGRPGIKWANGATIYFGPATNPPAAGTFVAGDIIINNSASGGSAFAIICTTGGSSGTWKNVGQCGYLSGAGTPSGSVVPDYIGQDYFDTGGHWYRSTGLTNASWVQLG